MISKELKVIYRWRLMGKWYLCRSAERRFRSDQRLSGDIIISVGWDFVKEA